MTNEPTRIRTAAARSYIEDTWGEQDGRAVDPRGARMVELLAAVEGEATRATVERIRARLLNEPTRDDGERTVGFITAILDEEAAA